MAPGRSRSQQRALRERAATQRAASDAAGGTGAKSTRQETRRPARTGRSYKSAHRSLWQGPYPYLGFVGAAVIVVLVIVVVGHLNSGPAPTTGNQSAIHNASTVPASMFNQVGLGSVQKGKSPLTALPSSAGALTGSNGKPEFLYMGAEWCPYCGAERWVMLTALSRFGTLSDVSLTTSSSTDVYPNTPTFTFVKATYQSTYLDFVPVEYQDRDHNALAQPTAEESALEQANDSNSDIPFLYLDGQYTQNGASFSPQDLAGISQGEIAKDLHNAPSATATMDILGNANVLVAAICKVTGGQPAAVCQSPGTEAGSGVLT